MLTVIRHKSLKIWSRTLERERLLVIKSVTNSKMSEFSPHQFLINQNVWMLEADGTRQTQAVGRGEDALNIKQQLLCLWNRHRRGENHRERVKSLHAVRGWSSLYFQGHVLYQQADVC